MGLGTDVARVPVMGAGLLREGGGAGWGPEGEGRTRTLTRSLKVLAELRLGFTIGPEAALLRELVGHGGGGDDGFEAALALGHILLRVEEDDVDLGHVEHPQGHRGAQTHRDRQRCRLDVQLEVGQGRRQKELCPSLRVPTPGTDTRGTDPGSPAPCPTDWAEGSCGVELGL